VPDILGIIYLTVAARCSACFWCSWKYPQPTLQKPLQFPILGSGNECALQSAVDGGVVRDLVGHVSPVERGAVQSGELRAFRILLLHE